MSKEQNLWKPLFLLLTFAILLMGCDTSGESATPTLQATETSVATAEPAATEELPPTTEPVATSAPTAAPTDETAAPTPRLSGVPEADAVIPTLLAHDAEAINELIHYNVIPCTTAEGLGGPPKCLEGETEGTLVEAFPTLGAEGGHIRPDGMNMLISLLHTDELYAVYELSDEVYADDAYPRGRYGVLFISDQEGFPTTTVHVDENGIVRIDYHLDESPDEVMAREAATLLLAPQQ